MATARPRPQVMRLSEAAATRIKELMVKADRPIAAVKVGVKNGGCAGMEYTMSYAEAPDAIDERGRAEHVGDAELADRCDDSVCGRVVGRFECAACGRRCKRQGDPDRRALEDMRID